MLDAVITEREISICDKFQAIRGGDGLWALQSLRKRGGGTTGAWLSFQCRWQVSGPQVQVSDSPLTQGQS
jgi:hypothetical protein